MRRASMVQTELTGLAVAIEDIGSTSVPGHAAEPVIDILVGIRAFANADAAIARFCDRDYVPVEYEGALWHPYLAFRDAPRADAQLAENYEQLKRRLAAGHRRDRAACTAGKSAFIMGVIGEHSGVDS